MGRLVVDDLGLSMALISIFWIFAVLLGSDEW